MKISKKSFISYMNRLIEYKKRENKLSDAMSEYCEDFYFFMPKDLESMIVDLLILLTGDNEKDSIISYWLYELNGGADWKPGTVTDVDGTDIKLQTPEDVYKYLIIYNESI